MAKTEKEHGNGVIVSLSHLF